MTESAPFTPAKTLLVLTDKTPRRVDRLHVSTSSSLFPTITHLTLDTSYRDHENAWAHDMGTYRLTLEQLRQLALALNERLKAIEPDDT